MKGIISVIIFIFLAIGTVNFSYATDLTITNRPTAGGVASAGAMNGYFDEIEDAVNDNNGRISTNATNISNNGTEIDNKVDVTGDVMTGDLTVPNLNYSSGVTRYYAISPADCIPYSNTYPYYINNSSLNPGSGAYSFYAPVHLPHNAVITDIDVFTYDYNTADYLSFYLYRHEPYGTSSTIAYGTGSDSGAPGNEELTDSTLNYTTIDNFTYNYSFRVYFGYGSGTYMKFYGARITYVVDAPLP